MEKLFTTIWEARDSYLIILNDNGMIYHTQTGGELHDEEEAQGFCYLFQFIKIKNFVMLYFLYFKTTIINIVTNAIYITIRNCVKT